MGRAFAKLNGRYSGILTALIISNAVSIGLLLIKMVANSSTDFGFLVWNLFLAWLALFFAMILKTYLNDHSWLSWQAMLLTVVWLGFLPNSFYLATDLIHLPLSSQATVLYDVVMLLSFSFNGFVSGLASVFVVHKQLVKRLKARTAYVLIGLTLFASSFAIYLGRYLRWNTWDVIVNPAGILFDVSDRIINPGAHPQAFVTTATFFALIGSVYLVAWQFVRAIKSD
ncbi:MAG TPA: DUF1361 domain-containing protein [Candidatus Saccharimonadales bacterium]|nr:DUF1361 domain-containing protein [Candidatus Saccharimonadales bacterium]